MSLESFIDTYGYLAVLVGTFFEVETILVLGRFFRTSGLSGFAQGDPGSPHRYPLPGSALFFLVRWNSQAVRARRPSWKGRVKKAHRLLDRFQTPLDLAFRFLYGLRTVAPFVIGMSRVSTTKFILLNVTGGAIWAVLVGVGGYLFGVSLKH